MFDAIVEVVVEVVLVDGSSANIWATVLVLVRADVEVSAVVVNSTVDVSAIIVVVDCSGV